MRDGRQPITVDQPVGKAVDMRQAVLDRAGHGDRVPAEVAEAGALNRDQVLDRFLTRPAIHQFDSEPGAQMCRSLAAKGFPADVTSRICVSGPAKLAGAYQTG